jgi:hypothetical protein
MTLASNTLNGACKLTIKRAERLFYHLRNISFKHYFKQVIRFEILTQSRFCYYSITTRHTFQ